MTEDYLDPDEVEIHDRLMALLVPHLQDIVHDLRRRKDINTDKLGVVLVALTAAVLHDEKEIIRVPGNMAFMILVLHRCMDAWHQQRESVKTLTTRIAELERELHEALARPLASANKYTVEK